eukprot:8849482-Pyramimonas_sp.AAC.1
MVAVHCRDPRTPPTLPEHVFGECRFEQRAREAGNEVADVTVLSTGELDPSQHAHPWALQFYQDLNAALAHPVGEKPKE